MRRWIPRCDAAILPAMCGRVFVRTSIDGIMRGFAFAQKGEAEQLGNTFPRWNGAPSLDYPLIVMDRDLKGPAFIRANWGFIGRRGPSTTGQRPPINARSETIATNGLFKFAYQQRRALLPIDGYFEWKDIFGTGKNKQPYAIAMADDAPFALAAIWESWRNANGEDFRTFAVITCEPNEMMATIHDRMPVVLAPEDYMRWLDLDDPDPRDLMKPFPSELMKMWPIGRKVGSPRNNTPDILDLAELGSEPPEPEKP